MLTKQSNRGTVKNGSRYVFPNRPRRFGKSLLFQRKELFNGLAISYYEKEG